MKSVLTPFLLTAAFVVSPFLVFAGDIHFSDGEIFLFFLILCIPLVLFLCGVGSLILFIDKRTLKRRRALVVFLVLQTLILMICAPGVPFESPVVPIAAIVLVVEFFCAVLVKVDGGGDEKECSEVKGERLINKNESNEA